jgi:hypothetical protein
MTPERRAEITKRQDQRREAFNASALPMEEDPFLVAREVGDLLAELARVERERDAFRDVLIRDGYHAPVPFNCNKCEPLLAASRPTEEPA